MANPEHLDWLKTGVPFWNTKRAESTFVPDLSGESLGAIPLSGVNLSKANLERCQFGGGNLANADLSHASVRFADFRDANLGGANLTKADFEGTYFMKTIFNGADCAGTNFDGAVLSGAIMEEAVNLVPGQLKKTHEAASARLPFELTGSSDQPQEEVDSDIDKQKFIIRQRIVQNSRDLAAIAALLVQDLDREIDRLESSLPNDEVRYNDHIGFLEFLKRIRGRVLSLAKALELASQGATEPAVDLTKHLGTEVSTWLAENKKEFVDLGIRVPAMGAAVALLSLCGANMVVATPVLMALFGGKKVADIIKETKK